MAAGVYNSDLKDINLCETITGFSALGGGASGLGAGVDFAIQGTNAVDKQVSNALKGMVFNSGSTITLGADDHILIWVVCSTPGLTSIKSAGGIRATIGTNTNAYYEWYINGSDTLPQGGMNNYAIFYDGATANNTVGSPGASPSHFGGQANINATSKGVNFALDAMRYGTGLYLTEGDITTPITFDSASQFSSDTNNRYGILAGIEGGYILKGRLVIGQDPNLNITQSYFNASNVNIAFLDTEFSTTDWTQIIVDHPSTIFRIQGVNITSLGTNNPGQLVFNNSSTTGSINNCKFNEIGKTFLQANVSITGSSFNSTDTIFQSGSNLFDNIFRTTAGVSSSILVTDPSKLNFNFFDNGGSKHGIEVISTGSYVFEANIFNNFDSGSNANEPLYFNPPGGTGDLTLQITGGGTSIEFRNASSGTVTIESNASITVTGLQDNTEVRIFDSATTGPQTELAGIEDAIDGTSGNRSFTFTLPVGTIVDIVLISVQYENQRLDGFEITISQDLPFEQTFDRNYSAIPEPPPSEIIALFDSLQSRSTYFENQSESEVFPTLLEDNNLLNSASLLYVASGYSSGSIQSLIPSSSAGDLMGIDTGVIFRPVNPLTLSRINSEGYVVSSSVSGIPKLNYSSTNIGKSGSFHLSPSFLIGNGYAINFLDNGTLSGPFGDAAVGGIISSSNTLTTFPVSGVTDPGGLTSASLIEDDNSGGSKEVWWGYEDVDPDGGTNNVNPYQFSIFAKPSGVNYLYFSASFNNSGSEQWFDLSTSTTGSSNGANLDSVFQVQDFPNGWKRVGVQYNQFGLNTGNMIVGISDTDGGKTVTADGTAKMYLWGVNSSRPNDTQIVGPRLTEFVYGSAESGLSPTIDAVLTTQVSSSVVPNLTSTDGYSVYFEGTYNISTMSSSSLIGINNSSAASEIKLYKENDEASNRFSITVRRGPSSGILRDSIGLTLTINSVNIMANGFNLTGAGITPDQPFLNGDFIKIGARIKDGDSKIFLNGLQLLSRTDNFTITNTADNIRFNNVSGLAFKTYAVFNKPLSDAELITLTSY